MGGLSTVGVGSQPRTPRIWKWLFDLNGEANRVRKKHNRAIIAADVRRFGRLINKDGVLGTHTACNLASN